MRASFYYFVSLLFVGVYSSVHQQIIGSLSLADNTYQCQNGASPAMTCVESSAPPNCSCHCSNGIMYNHTLTIASTIGSGTCQSEKDKCLGRTQQLEDELTNTQHAYDKCEERLLKQSQAHSKELETLSQELAMYKKTSSKYMGCYVDSASNRILKHYSDLHSKTMTVEVCASVCQDYQYYGVEGGEYCFCGDQVRGAPKKVDGKECSTLCPAEKGQICGGDWRLSLYVRG